MSTPIKTSYTGLHRRHDTAVFEKHTLSNGITVWRQRSPILLTEEGILIAFFPGVGSVLDPVGKEGLTHFFEHVPAKGTKRFDSKLELTEFVRSRGGSRNASTGLSSMDAWVTMPRDHYADAVAELFSLVRDPLFRKEDVEVERGVILSEHTRKYTNGAYRAHRDIHTALFEGHPIVQLPIGTHEGISSVTVEDVVSFFDAYYHAGTLNLIVGGTFSERPDIFEELEKTFGTMPARPRDLPTMPAFPIGKSGNLTFSDSHYGRDLLSLNWLLPAGDVRASMPLSLLTGAFAGGSDAPLVVELREKLGLSYDSSMHVNRMPYGWVVTADLTVPAAHFSKVQEVFFTTLRALTTDRVVKILNRWQLDRSHEFTEPTRVCLSIEKEVVNDGHPFSHKEEEEMADIIDLDSVWRWRDYLLNNEPFVARVIAKDP